MNGINEVNKAKGKQKVQSVIPDAIFLALLDQQLYNGFTYNQNIQATIQYNVQQLYKQILINIQQQKELKIENNEFQRLIQQQNNQKLCINGEKISGSMDLTMIGLNNLAKVEGIKLLDKNAKVRFVSDMCKNVTDICENMHGKEFYINKENSFDRYWRRD